MDRKRLGIVYTYNKNWVAGSYYVSNLVRALNTLPDNEKPDLTILLNSDDELALHFDYPYYRVEKYGFNYSFAERLINKFWRSVFARNLIKKGYTTLHFDAVFPLWNESLFDAIPRRVYWIPDFQDVHYPALFSSEELSFRRALQEKIASQAVDVVFSSKDALADYTSLFPESKAKTHVVNFAVYHPEYSNIDFDSLKQKYHIDGDYYFSPNQFWAHKNHKLILEAVLELKNEGKNVKVLFSGKEYDYRNPNYTVDLKDFVDKNGLSDHVTFLGFIDRAEQLMIMKHAIAVVQPSLFEGWSTSIEDAKAMNQFVLASDIGVHKEQIERNVRFFKASDHIQLAGLMKTYSENRPELESANYEINRQVFARDFISILT